MKIPKDCLKKYTIIQPDPTLRNNLMVFGFEIGEGWMSLVIELLDKIQHLVDNNPEYSGLQVIQVKEKFAQLRVYLNYYYKEIEDLIEEYTEKSVHICELCGETGETRNLHGWYMTLCDKHYEERLGK